MLPRLRPTYANVTATLALALALGTGTSYAVERLALNSVSAKHIKADAVQTSEIRAGAVKSPELAAGAVRSADLAAGNVTSAHIANGTVRSEDLAAGLTSTVLHAHVDYDGTLINGREVFDSVMNNPGEYTVTFTRQVEGCGISATPSFDQSDLMVTTQGASVHVDVEDPDFEESPYDQDFYVLIVC